MCQVFSVALIKYYGRKELRGKVIYSFLQLQIDTVHHGGQRGVWVAGQSEQEVG